MAHRDQSKEHHQILTGKDEAYPKKIASEEGSNQEAPHDEDAAKSSRLEKSLGENCKKFLELFGA